MPEGLEPQSGSVRPKQPMISPVAIFGQVALLLRVRLPNVWIGYMTSAALHAGEAANARVAALELLHHEAVADVAQPGAAVPVRLRRAGPASRSAARELLHRKRAVLPHVLLDARQELLADEGAHGVAREPLLVAVQLVEVQEVHALEVRHEAPSAMPQ